MGGDLNIKFNRDMRNILKNYKIFEIDPKKLRSQDFFGNMLEYRGKMMNQFRTEVKLDRDFRCPLCRSEIGNLFLKYKDYPLFECAKCGLVSPNVKFDNLEGEEVYDDPGYIKHTVREIVDTYEYRKNTYAPERLEYILSKTDLKKEKINLLDVGCGPGYFLSYLQDNGVKCRGLELAEFLVKICKDRGLDVDKIDLKEEKDGAYNLITLFDVLEHLDDPIGFFKMINNKLDSNGYVLAYTPNIHSIAYYLMEGKQNTLLPYQHLCFFDKKSLEYLADKTGFRVKSIEYYGLDVMDYLYMKNYEDGFDYHTKLKDFIQVMQAIVDKQGLSNHMRIILKKI